MNALRVGLRLVAFIALSALVCPDTGCRRKQEEMLIVRILLPPGHSAVGEEIVKLEAFPLKADTGKTIIPATLATKSEGDYRDFLQRARTSEPEEALIVPTAEDIPTTLRGETRYPTLPCTTSPRPCIALIAPWATIEERQALEIVLPRLAPDANSK